MSEKRKGHKSFIKLIKHKVKKMINIANYYTTENYDVLVFIITYLYLLYTHDNMGAKIMLTQQELDCDKINKKIIDCVNDIAEYLNSTRKDTGNTDA